MSKHRKVLLVVIIIVIIAGVVAYYFFFRGRFGGVVSVTGVELYIRSGDVSEAQTPIEVCINVENSFPVSVRVEGGSLAVILSGLRLADVSIPAQEVKQGRTTLIVNAILDNTLLDDFWYRHLSQGEKSNMFIEGSIRVGTPIGSLELPVRFSNIIETKIFPIVQELNREYDVAILGKVVVRKAVIELVNVTPYETKLKALITIENDLKALPLHMSGVVFSIKTGGGNTLGFGEQETPKIIAPSEIDTIVFSVTIDNTKIPKLWVEHIRNMEKTIVNIEIWLKVKIAGKELELFKEHPLTVSTEIKTNIFKYKG